MRTYKYVYRAIFIVLLVPSYLTHSQIRPKKNRGEYLKFDEIKDLHKRSTGETELDDFSFNWDNNFNTAINNQILLKRAREKAKREWFRKQKNRIRENIEKKLGDNFDNYTQAKEALFLFSEKENIYRNSKPTINKYKSLRSNGYGISKGYLKELKLLQLRKIEIGAGTIHNSKYGYLKANGMFLKDIKDINTINQKWDNIVIPLESNINNTHYNTSIYQKLNNLGTDFNKEIIALKNNYYNSFDQWEQLNLMQLLLNFEEYKRFPGFGVCLLPSSFYKFKELDIATSQVIETFAINNRDKRTSIFDTTIDYYGGYAGYMLWIQSKRQEAINNLINEVNTVGFATENLIAELKITDASQKKWLYSVANSPEVSNLTDFLQNNRVHGVVAVEVMNFAKEAINAFLNGAEVDFEEHIINELTGKADCAFNKLLSSGISNFHNMITDLFIEFGDHNIGARDLTFKMSNFLPNDVGGKTEYYGNGKYGILVNENLMNTTSSIEIASILVHEMAHAFLGKHYNDSNSSFSELYEKYINDTGIQNYSHNIMRDQFINRMATTLQNYDSSIFSSFVDYKILASQGVFQLTNDQKNDLLAVKLKSRKNNTNCD